MRRRPLLTVLIPALLVPGAVTAQEPAAPAAVSPAPAAAPPAPAASSPAPAAAPPAPAAAPPAPAASSPAPAAAPPAAPTSPEPGSPATAPPPVQAAPGAAATARRPARGTHFLGEINAGSTTYGSGGLATALLFGGGGKVPDLPLRLYLIAELAYLVGATTGETALAGLAYRDERRYGDLGLGLRCYLPVHRQLRLFADFQLGGSHVSARLEREHLDTRQASGWVLLGQLAAGLQLRLTSNLSLGLRAKLLLTDDDVAGLRQMMGDEPPLRSAAAVSMSWHL